MTIPLRWIHADAALAVGSGEQSMTSTPGLQDVARKFLARDACVRKAALALPGGLLLAALVLPAELVSATLVLRA